MFQIDPLSLLIGCIAGGVIGIGIKYMLSDINGYNDEPAKVSEDSSIIRFLAEVDKEILRARAKFPDNKHLLGELMEEVGELAKAHLEDESYERKRTEAVQVACVAARIAMDRDGDYEPVERDLIPEAVFCSDRGQTT